MPATAPTGRREGPVAPSRRRFTVRRAAVDALALPALLTIAVGLLLAVHDGGFGGESWYPAALFVLALLTLSVTVAPPDGVDAAPRIVRRALAALVAFALWALLSATWSDVPALAWDGANHVFLYAIVLALATLRPWPADTFAIALGLVSVGLAAIALGVLVDLAGGDSSASMFIESRLSEPTGYANATASLWLIGVWPALALACHGRAAWIVRAGALGVACLLMQTSLLSVSRGGLLATGVTALVFVALSHDRHKAFAGLAVLFGCGLLAAGPVFAVGDAITAPELERALDPAIMAIALTCALATVLGATAILVARRVAAGMSTEARTAWPRRAVRASALLAVLAATLAILSAGGPATWVDARWQDFKTSGYTEVKTGSARITGSLGSNRYDFYRVALNEFAEHPLAGIGYGSFQVPYLIDRRSDEAPIYTHSLAIGVLSQVGLVGAVLLLAFLTCALMAAARSLAAGDGRRTLVAGALAGFTVWFVHGLVDWLWEFPGLGILAFALLGLAMRGVAPGVHAASAPQPPRGSVGLARRAAAAVVIIAVAASFAMLGIGARLTRTALDEATTDPARATQRLEQAARFNALAAGPLLTRGLLAQRLGDHDAAHSAFARALEREPRNWFAELELGLVHADAGRRAPALRALARASRLNPRQDVIEEVLATVRAGGRVDPAAVERALDDDRRRRLRNVTGG